MEKQYTYLLSYLQVLRLRPARHEICHFGDVLSGYFLGLVLKKLNQHNKSKEGKLCPWLLLYRTLQATNQWQRSACRQHGDHIDIANITRHRDHYGKTGST